MTQPNPTRRGAPVDPTGRYGDAVGGGFGGNIDHMGLALGVEMGECVHGL